MAGRTTPLYACRSPIQLPHLSEMQRCDALRQSINYIEVLAGVISWGFKSPSPHQIFFSSSLLSKLPPCWRSSNYFRRRRVLVFSEAVPHRQLSRHPNSSAVPHDMRVCGKSGYRAPNEFRGF